jgi:hypothetical protein
MSLLGLLSFALVYFVFVLSPGPGVAATVARGLGTGTHNAFGYITGFVLGDIVWFTIAATGLAALATQFETAFTVFKYLGCAYLLWMAWKIWSTPVAATEVDAKAFAQGQWQGFLGTFTLTLSCGLRHVNLHCALPRHASAPRVPFTDCAAPHQPHIGRPNGRCSCCGGAEGLVLRPHAHQIGADLVQPVSDGAICIAKGCNCIVEIKQQFALLIISDQASDPADNRKAFA